MDPEDEDGNIFYGREFLQINHSFMRYPIPMIRDHLNYTLSKCSILCDYIINVIGTEEIDTECGKSQSRRKAKMYFGLYSKFLLPDKTSKI